MGSRWIILRTSGRCTLPLAASLRRAGYDVWTPVRVQRIRVPKMNARRVIEEPLLKGFVFGDYDRRHDLLRLSERPAPHTDFSILRDFGEIARLEDSKLDGLRWIEARANLATKKTERSIPEGVKVRVGSGLFSGMIGVVRRSKRGLTLVCFNDRYSAEIPTSLLAENEVSELRPASYAGPAALAA